jgi:hypothetical protein
MTARTSAHTGPACLALGQPYLPTPASGTCARVARHVAPVRAAARPIPTPGGSAGAGEKSKRVFASTPGAGFFSRIHNLKRGADHVG